MDFDNFANEYNNLVKKIMPIIIEDENKRKERRSRGEDFNIFRVMGLQNDEVHTHSAMIAALLDPNQSHGAKETFLNLFVEQIKILNEYVGKIRTATVDTERPIGVLSNDKETGGRLDVVLDIELIDGKKVLIVIENKIFAGDQNKQICRYINYAQEVKKNNDYSEFFIFYLTLSGDDPSKNSTNGLKEYHTLSYKSDIFNWLEKCLEKTYDRPLVRETIIQYKNLIASLTQQDMDKSAQEKLAQEVASSYDNMKLAIAINSNYNEILNQMCEKKLREIFDNIKKEERNLEYRIYGESWCSQYCGVFFYKQEWEKLGFAFEFLKPGLNDFIYGIKYRDENETSKDLIINEIKEKKGSGFNSGWYPWYNYVPGYRNFSTEFVDALYLGKLKDKIQELAESNIKLLNELADNL